MFISRLSYDSNAIILVDRPVYIQDFPSLGISGTVSWGCTEGDRDRYTYSFYFINHAFTYGYTAGIRTRAVDKDKMLEHFIFKSKQAGFRSFLEDAKQYAGRHLTLSVTSKERIPVKFRFTPKDLTSCLSCYKSKAANLGVKYCIEKIFFLYNCLFPLVGRDVCSVIASCLYSLLLLDNNLYQRKVLHLYKP